MNKPSWIFLLLFFLKFLEIKAQVWVHEEPRHHLVFQNKSMRILQVLIPPGDTSLYHIHHTPSLFILLSNTHTGSQLRGQSPLEGKNEAGRIYYENLDYPHDRIHRVWNQDRDTMQVMDIELLLGNQNLNKKPLVINTLELDTSGIRVYRIKLHPGEKIQLEGNKRNLIFISLNTSFLQIRTKDVTFKKIFNPGNFYGLLKQRPTFISNPENRTAELALIEYPN